MTKKAWFYIGFFALLLGAFYFFVFYDYDFSQSKLKVINPEVPAFAFIDQDGKPITRNNTDDKVYVAEYFFTTCKGICPRMNNNLKTVYEKYKDDPDFMIVSHTSDPETDSAGKLKQYAARLHIDTSRWVFLTGRKDSLYQQARESYLLDDPKNSVVNINDQFLHTQFFALVDKNGNVRGQIYDGLKAAELKQLENDIDNLLTEKTQQGNFANSIFTNTP